MRMYFLGIESPDDVLILNIVTIDKDVPQKIMQTLLVPSLLTVDPVRVSRSLSPIMSGTPLNTNCLLAALRRAYWD